MAFEIGKESLVVGEVEDECSCNLGNLVKGFSFMEVGLMKDWG